LIKSPPIKISLLWAKGHHTGTNQQLAHKLNKITQDLAYNFLKQPHPSSIPSPRVVAPPPENILLEYDNSLITPKMPQLLKYHVHEEPLIDTICKEAKWDRTIFHSVDWVAYGKAFQNLPRGKQISCSKLNHGIINKNVQNSRFYNLSNKIPYCSLHQESITHLLTCQDTVAGNHRKEATPNKLLEQLGKTHTPACLICLI
jgi:hypothetical protein